MRLLHTADWHLGRSLHGASLLEDQRHLLGELVRLAAETRPDAVLVAGDVFDRAVPPAEAVELLDEVLCRLVLDLRLPTVLIAGNHDSPARLAFGARLLEQARLAIAGEARPRTVFTLQDAWGEVAICAVPYAEPAQVRHALGCEAVDHAAALAAQIAALGERQIARSVLVGHVFVTGGAACDSERPLSVGGAGCVPLTAFNGFAYTALGHLHRPQGFGGERVRYAGSLFPYGFDESEQAKSASLVEIAADGTVRVEPIALDARRRVRTVRGRFADLLRAERSDDYVCAVLEDTEALLDPFARLREVYPHLLDIRRPFYAAGTVPRREGEALPTGRDVPELFADFFGQVTGGPMSEAEQALLRELVEAWQREEREAA
jgi:exonuclease SbcD